MKSISMFLSILVLMVVGFSSCSKSDNPADNDIFIGTYSGKTAYAASGSLTYGDGKITVTKLGDTYRFDFNNNGNIPAITGVKIAKGDNGYVGTVNGYTGTINITASKLTILVGKDGASWGADCTR